MFALTIDQRRSREKPDAVPGLLKNLNRHDLVRQFERTAGDEVQGLVNDPAILVSIVAEVAATSQWWVGVGIGDVIEPIPVSVRESQGPALIAARAAVERSPKASFGVAVEGQRARHSETALQMLAGILSARSAEGQAAVEAMQSRTNQRQAAEHLGISAQAMSRRLQVARWADERRVRDLAVHLLVEAASGEPAASSEAG